MSKIDIIDYCGDCSHRWYESNANMLCDLTDLSTSENNPCPPWCPLPKYQNFTDDQIRKLAESCGFYAVDIWWKSNTARFKLLIQKILEVESNYSP